LCQNSFERVLSCNEFYLYCCACNQEPLDFPQDRRPAKFCHHFHIAFTDGACTNNGRPGAKAGIGVACGNDDSSQLSKPITDKVDNFPLRSNQRAELCAAKSGLEFFAEAYTKDSKSEAAALIVATDSEYVVKGMTEWLPKWKVCMSVLTRVSSDASDRVYRNNWRTAKGTTPKNLDLFLALDGVVTTLEAENATVSCHTQMYIGCMQD
jgi:ribonuclease HI